MQTQQVHTPTDAQPIVSFVIPCHNQPAAFVKECLDSIRALSLQKEEREIILVDDGSETAVIDQLSDYADELTYIRKANGGVSTARNTGLRIAKGTFIQFIDADDRLAQHPYEHVLHLARLGRADIIMFDYYQTEKPAESTYADEAPTNGCQLMHTSNIHGSACSYLFRRSIVGKLQFTPGIDYGEDEEFTPQLLLRADRVVRTTAKAYYYRQHPASAINDASMERRQKRLDDNLKVIAHLNKLCDTLPAGERHALTRRVNQLTMDYIYNTIRYHHDLTLQLDKLRQLGLYPLPLRDYTRKYAWFSRLANNPAGLRLLKLAIPLMSDEK